MTISRIKTILIILLAALTVYQTGILWFVNITNRNFLLNYFPFLQQLAIPEGADRLVVPWRLVTVHGDGTVSAQYNRLADAESWQYSQDVLLKLIQDGRFVAMHSADFSDMLSYLRWPAYVIEYAFPMGAEWFTYGFGERGNTLTRPGLSFFQQIFIIPQYDSDQARIFFLCENGYAYEFSVSDLSAHYITPDATGPFYRASDTGFVRQSPRISVTSVNPYVGPAGLMITFVQDQLAGFFSNPAAIRPMVTDYVWVYRDANTVVRYYVTNIIEFISYHTIDRSVPSSFLSDFAAAAQFIERDHLVANEFYLAGFWEDGGSHVFYFNYVVGDMPLSLPGGYPITITVDHGTVVRYRKLAYNFFEDV